MDEQSNKYSTIVSLILHILLIFFLFYVRKANILVPSRSDGMTVDLVTLPSPVAVAPAPAVTPKVTPPVVSNADINLKKPDTTPPKANKVESAPPAPVAPQLKTATTKKNKLDKAKTNPALNSILNQITGSTTVHTGKTKGKAVGGVNGGLANSNNMVNNYANLVIERVRPYIVIPPDLSSDSVAIVKVTLLPNMQVYQVDLDKSSGNTQYDNNVQDAINKVGVFPPIPQGQDWSDYRVIYLTFRPE